MDDGVIAHEVAVELPRPRHIGHPTLVRLRTELLGRLGIVEPAAAGE